MAPWSFWVLRRPGRLMSLQESTVSPDTPACSLLVRSLSGRTLFCSLPADFTVDDLERCISEYTAVPRSAFFLDVSSENDLC